jgi:Flp pilus assembly protein TadG
MRSRYRTLLRGTKLIEQFWRARTGSVAIMLGVALPVVIGVAALGTEIAFSLVKYRQLQIVADAAALDAATATQKGYPNFAVEAKAVAAALGAQNGVNGVTVTANSPPSSGPNANKSGAVEVIVSQPRCHWRAFLPAAPSTLLRAQSRRLAQERAACCSSILRPALP